MPTTLAGLAASNHTSFPPAHPGTPPPGVTAVSCYQTALEAASAGYPPARPPADVLEVGGVYLAPTSASFQARCRRAADRLRFAVPCPGLLPTPAPGVPPPRLCEEPPTCPASAGGSSGSSGTGSSWGGTILLRRSQQGTLVEVGVTGRSEVNQQLVVAVAEHLRLVEPST
jgi:hypothetical protein